MLFYQKLLTASLSLPRNTLLLTKFNKNFSTSTSPLFFQYTQPLCAEPLKKKKRVDPQIVKAREDRRKKKVEKEIRKLKRNARQLKPVEENETPLGLLEQKEARQRQVPQHSEEVIQSRKDILRQWSAYKCKEYQNDYKIIDRLIYSQRKALDELRLESEELYQEAIQFDNSLIPFYAKGPLSTPPIKNYDSPDGDYKDITRDFVKEYEDRKMNLEDYLNRHKRGYQIKKKK